MTREEFTGATFNDLDSSGTRISRPSEFSVANSTEIVLNILHKTSILYIGKLYRQHSNTESGQKPAKIRKALFVNLCPLYVIDRPMR